MSDESEPFNDDEPEESEPSSRIPIFNDETPEEARLSKLIEESVRRGIEASQRRAYETLPKPRVAPEEPEQELAEIDVIDTSNEGLPIYNKNFGFTHLLGTRHFKVNLWLFIAITLIIPALWIATEQINKALVVLSIPGRVDLFSPILPFIWIPIAIFLFISARTILLVKYTRLMTTDSGYLTIEIPTIIPLLVFGSSNGVRIDQIGSIDDKREFFAFILLKTRRVTVDTPSDESDSFKNMRGVKDIELFKKALGR